MNKWKERHVQNFKIEELLPLAWIEPSNAFTAWRPRVPQFFIEAIGFGHGKAVTKRDQVEKRKTIEAIREIEDLPDVVHNLWARVMRRFFMMSLLCTRCATRRGASDEIQGDASRWTGEHIWYSDAILWAKGCARSPLFALNRTSKRWRSEAGEQLEHYGEGRRQRRGALCRLRSTEAKHTLGTLRSNGGWRRRHGASCRSSSKPWPTSLDTCLHSNTHAHDPESIRYHFLGIDQYLNTSSGWNLVIHKMNRLHFWDILWSIG